MKWHNFLNIFGALPLIKSELVYSTGSAAGDLTSSLEVQISRWMQSERLIQLKRGLYLINEPYRKVEPYEPHVACELTRPSYISLEKALEMHNLIPEAVYTFTMVTTKRPAHYETVLGVFDYRYIQRNLFWGYTTLTHQNQTAFWATPEKALLDYFYFTAGEITEDFLAEMRLQSLEVIDPDKLASFAKRFQKPKITRAAHALLKFREQQLAEERKL
jgi:predicted transcriptional regulator of viral defense system